MTPPDPKRSAPIDEGKFSRVSRRELLKLLPVLGLGAFAVPGWQEPLLKKGLGLSDWASSKLFRKGHLAPIFSGIPILTAIGNFPLTTTTSMIPGSFSRTGT